MNTCKTLLIQISSYLDKETTSEENTIVEQHLESCSSCHEIFSQYQQGRSQLKQLKTQISSQEATLKAIDLKSDILEKIHSEMLSDFQLMEYLDQECSQEQKIQIEAHLESCDFCAKEYKQYLKARDLLVSAQPSSKPHSQSIYDRVMEQIKIEYTVHAPTFISHSNEHIGDRISAYLDRELPLELQKTMEQHCLQCAYCAGEVKRLQADMGLLRQANSHHSPEELSYQILEKIHEDENLTTLDLRPGLGWLNTNPQPLVSRRTLFLQAAAVLFILGSLFSAPWWWTSNSQSSQHYAKNTDPKRDLIPIPKLEQMWAKNSQIATRRTQVQEMMQLAFACYPTNERVGDARVLSHSIAKVEGYRLYSKKLIQEIGLVYNPYEGDLDLLKGLLLHLTYQINKSWYLKEEEQRIQDLKEIKDLYLSAMRSYQRPLAMTQFHMPAHLKFPPLSQNYVNPTQILDDVKKLVEQIEQESQNPLQKTGDKY